MHELTYTSSRGVIIDLEDPSTVLVGTATGVRGSEWSYELDELGISAAVRVARETELAMVVTSASAMEAAQAEFESDVASGTPGTISHGGWSQGAYVTKVEVEAVRPSHLVLTLTVVLCDGVWRRSTTYHLTPASADTTTTTGLDYPTDFPFDYAGTATSSGLGDLVTEAETSIGLVFYGACSNPYVRMTSASSSGATTNIYGVNASADAGERIVIDPRNRSVVGGSVYSVGQWGERTNLFASRRRGTAGSGSYVFERMPAGTLSVSWPQSLAVDVIVIEERGQLPWS